MCPIKRSGSITRIKLLSDSTCFGIYSRALFKTRGYLSIGVKGILLYGSEDQKQRYLPRAASGDMIFAYALTEPKRGSDARNIETTALLDGDQYILNGQKTYITNANYAGGFTVFAQMYPENPGFMGAFIVEASREGVKIGKDLPKMGLKASSTASIRFENVRLPKKNLLGRSGDGFMIAMTILNYGRLGLGATSTGMMAQSLRDMIDRASSRRQFGVPIGNFELIKEKIVRAGVHEFVASAMVSMTAGLLQDRPTANVAIESSHCKLFGTTRAWDTLYDALQVAGGAGYISTQPYERRMRDFRVTTIFEGTTEIHSMYPALFLLRRLEKQMEAAVGVGKMSRFFWLLKGFFKQDRISLKFNLDDRAMKKAARFVKANIRSVRRMIYWGLLVHGKHVNEKQFFLRRASTLSLYLYGTLSALVKLRADKKNGRGVSRETTMLLYFLEEAGGARRTAKKLFPSRRETLHKKIFDGGQYSHHLPPEKISVS